MMLYEAEVTYMCLTPAGCDYASVERVNRDHIHPMLQAIVHTPFFQYFKVDLFSDCPFWPDDGMCMLRDCGVDECAPEEVPGTWLEAEMLDQDDEECGQSAA